jgi:hypothetical protein
MLGADASANWMKSGGETGYASANPVRARSQCRYHSRPLTFPQLVPRSLAVPPGPGRQWAGDCRSLRSRVGAGAGTSPFACVCRHVVVARQTIYAARHRPPIEAPEEMACGPTGARSAWPPQERRHGGTMDFRQLIRPDKQAHPGTQPVGLNAACTGVFHTGPGRPALARPRRATSGVEVTIGLAAKPTASPVYARRRQACEES